MSERVFLLGLGNQKCGTTWVHSYLKQCSNFDGGFKKEYHVWDALDTPIKRESRVSVKRGLLGSPSERQLFKMQTLPEYYFKYFTELFTQKVTVTADISPSYSGLSVKRLTFIRDKFAVRGVTVKPVVFIREPVSRIKSAVRFNLDRKNFSEGIKRGETDFRLALLQYYKSEHCRLRTNYSVAIEAAKEVFGAESLYVGIFENMFESEEIDRMSNFMNVPAKPEFAKKAVNKTRGNKEDHEDIEQEIRKTYGEVYDYCFRNFPQTRELWS